MLEHKESAVNLNTSDGIKQAEQEFDRKEYGKCMELLQQLEETSDNVKLRHNQAVTQFYGSDCREHLTLLKRLNKLVADEAVTLVSPSYGSPIVKYNKATIYFHRHMYRTAIEMLAPLVEKLDALEQDIAARVGILMLRLLLSLNELSKAQGFLEYFQAQLGIVVDVSVSAELTLPDSLARLEGFARAFHFLLLLTNMLNGKVVVVPTDGSVEFAALKAHQFYLLKDFQMAAKQLMKINTDSHNSGAQSDELNTCIANNMGVIHLRVRHYSIAAKCFQNAIAFDKHIAAHLRTAQLQQMSAAHSCEILYNLGISMLYLRQPKEAFQCFLVPLKSYHSNPRLWLRMAESCIMDHELKVLEEEKKPIVSAVQNVGVRRMYVIKPSPKPLYASSGQSAAVPEPTMEFAALCLRNALTLTRYYKDTFHEPRSDAETEAMAASWTHSKDNNFCNPSRPTSKQSLTNLLSAICAAYSYVSLRLGDYLTALERAQDLLASESLSDSHKMLAHMYAGEALIMLDKLAEARPHLEPTFVASLNAFDFETKDWQVKSLDAAQNVVRYNLAVAMVLQGDFDMAVNLMRTCTHALVAGKITALQMYINIKLGKCG